MFVIVISPQVLDCTIESNVKFIIHFCRLYESHKRVQKVNQTLEDRLLAMADKCSSDKSQLARDVETLSVRLAESNYNMTGLHKENVST